MFLNFIFGIILFIGCSNDTKTLDFNLNSKDIETKITKDGLILYYLKEKFNGKINNLRLFESTSNIDDDFLDNLYSMNVNVIDGKFNGKFELRVDNQSDFQSNYIIESNFDNGLLNGSLKVFSEDWDNPWNKKNLILESSINNFPIVNILSDNPIDNFQFTSPVNVIDLCNGETSWYYHNNGSIYKHGRLNDKLFSKSVFEGPVKIYHENGNLKYNFNLVYFSDWVKDFKKSKFYKNNFWFQYSPEYDMYDYNYDDSSYMKYDIRKWVETRFDGTFEKYFDNGTLEYITKYCGHIEIGPSELYSNDGKLIKSSTSDYWCQENDQCLEKDKSYIINKLSQQNKELLTFQTIGKRKYLINIGILNNRGQTDVEQRVLDYSNSPCD